MLLSPASSLPTAIGVLGKGVLPGRAHLPGWGRVSKERDQGGRADRRMAASLSLNPAQRLAMLTFAGPGVSVACRVRLTMEVRGRGRRSWHAVLLPSRWLKISTKRSIKKKYFFLFFLPPHSWLFSRILLKWMFTLSWEIREQSCCFYNVFSVRRKERTMSGWVAGWPAVGRPVGCTTLSLPIRLGGLSRICICTYYLIQMQF